MLNNNVVVKICARTVNGEPVSPWKIFLLAKLRWHLLTLNFFSCRFGTAPSHLQIFSPADLAWHLPGLLNAPKNKNNQAKIQIQTEIIETTMKSASLQTKISYSLQNIQILLKNHEMVWKSPETNSKCTQPNCTTITAIIVTNTTKYGSVHRSGTWHHKPSCKNTKRSQKTIKGHKRPPRIQMPLRDNKHFHKISPWKRRSHQKQKWSIESQKWRPNIDDRWEKNSSKWIGWREARKIDFSSSRILIIRDIFHGTKNKYFFWPENVPQIEVFLVGVVFVDLVLWEALYLRHVFKSKKVLVLAP